MARAESEEQPKDFAVKHDSYSMMPPIRDLFVLMHG